MTQICHKRIRDTALLLMIPTIAALACQQGAANANNPSTSGDSLSPVNAASSATTMLDASTDSTITVQTNASFDIRLHIAAGQGYSWLLLDSTYTYIRQDRPQTFEALPGSKPGSDGIQIFHFRALKPGKEAIKMIYVQPFNKPYPTNAPHKTYQIMIR